MINDYFKMAYARLEKRPLFYLLLIGLLLRLVSVVWSKGYGWHDDHFLIIEAAQSWVDGYDYNNWLPQNSGVPSGHSFFYVGIHFLLLKGMSWIGIAEPQTRMLLIRLMHALLSLLVIYYGYRILEKSSNKEVALQGGLLLAALWFMPFLSVRNLVEVVCIVPLMAGPWMLMRAPKQRLLDYLFGGLLFGIAFSVRFQTALFFVGACGVLLWMRQWRPLVVFALAYALCVLVVQGGIDLFVWGRPFAEFGEYVRYNLENAGSYGGMPWYNYIFLILGMLLPPVSFFLIFGYARSFAKHLLLTLPALVFLLFHFYFQNRQERFILPAIPFLIMAGLMGWQSFRAESLFWQKHALLYKRCIAVFWILNLILLVPISLHYTKKDKVEAMTYLRKKGDARAYIMEDSNRDFRMLMPDFYWGRWAHFQDIVNDTKLDEFIPYLKQIPYADRPNYILFLQDENIEARVAKMKSYYPSLTYETTIHPSFIDDLLHRINRHNRNQTIYIYKID